MAKATNVCIWLGYKSHEQKEITLQELFFFFFFIKHKNIVSWNNYLWINIKRTNLTYFSCKLPLLCCILGDRIAICTKCFTYFQDFCPCLLPRKENHKYNFLHLWAQNQLVNKPPTEIEYDYHWDKETMSEKIRDQYHHFWCWRIHDLLVRKCLVEKHIASCCTKQHSFEPKKFFFVNDSTNKSQSWLIQGFRPHFLWRK